MKKNDLTDRTFKFVELLPNNRVSSVISYQILKSATSVGANYRAT